MAIITQPDGRNTNNTKIYVKSILTILESQGGIFLREIKMMTIQWKLDGILAPISRKILGISI